MNRARRTRTTPRGSGGDELFDVVRNQGPGNVPEPTTMVLLDPDGKELVSPELSEEFKKRN
ncbi:MAG: hypothetical protein ABJC10_11360 [Acidobacteriota bacterium]